MSLTDESTRERQGGWSGPRVLSYPSAARRKSVAASLNLVPAYAGKPDDGVHDQRRNQHQHVSLPEPANWRESFPEFVDRDKPWNRLDAAQQTFIINTMPVMAHLSEPVEAVEDSMKLRNA